MRPREGERRGRFTSGMVRKFLCPPTPPRPPSPYGSRRTPKGERERRKAGRAVEIVRICSSVVYCPPERVQSCVFTAVRRSLSGRSSRSLSCVVLVSLARSFPACHVARGVSPDFPDGLGYSVVRCRQLATKPTPAGRYLHGNVNKLQKKRLLQAYGAFFGLRNVVVLVIFEYRKGRRF